MTPDQLATAMAGIRRKVTDRFRKPVTEMPDFELADLGPLEQIREAADDKAAAIGRVNPRGPGLLNSFVQGWKKLVARLLYWHVREQIEFNRAVVRYIDHMWVTNLKQHKSLLRVAHELEVVRREQGKIRERVARLEVQAAEVGQRQADMLRHWNQWQPAFEEKLTETEIRFLHMIREMESDARQRDAGMRKLHQDFLGALTHATDELQSKFWADLKELQAEQERLIHTELRLIRQRTRQHPESAEVVDSSSQPHAEGIESKTGLPPLNGAAGSPASLDYARFEERFRGEEEYVAESQTFYLPYFQHCRQVLDLGCGRGEFLHLLGKHGVSGRGIDSNADAIAACREKGLAVEQDDLLSFLSRQPNESVDGIFSSHVVEHLPPEHLPMLISLAVEKLAPGGILAIETPNPSCLAVYAGDFYQDPTHLRPVPSALLHFYFQEGGLSEIEVHELHPSAEVFPEISALDKLEELQDFRRKFFGGLDYAILGRKPRA